MKLSTYFLAAIAVAGLAATTGARAQKSHVNFASPVGNACTMTDEAAQVQATLNRFTAAVSAHDVAQMQAVGIKASSAKGWQSFFRSNPRATVTDDCPASTLSILGETATWSCNETATILSEGKPAAFNQVIRFSFARQNGVWVITDRR